MKAKHMVVGVSICLLYIGVALIAPTAILAQTEPLKVCATVPDLGDIVRRVGGDEVTIEVFAKGPEDPHFVEARPSFIKKLSDADLFIQVGLELEVGWVPLLLQSARNSRILPGAPGYVDASTAITPIEIPLSPVDRSMGDVHGLGNPHYLADPINGLKVAALVRDRLAELVPTQRERFIEHYKTFEREVAVMLVGEVLSTKYDITKLAQLFEAGKLDEFLQTQREEKMLSGWFKVYLPFRGAKLISDHNLWPYFVRRFGLFTAGFLEPKPGVPPTTKHLEQLITQMKADHVGIVVTAPYYDERHSAFVAEQTGAVVVRMAHQCQAMDEAKDYLSMVNFNLSQLSKALHPTS